jgi:hypothetical protein
MSEIKNIFLKKKKPLFPKSLQKKMREESLKSQNKDNAGIK